MNKIKNIIYAFILLGTVGLSSCLKDDEIWGPDAPGYVASVIEISDMASVTSESNSTYPRWTFAFDPEDEVTLDVLVNYAGADVAPADITVDLVVDPSIIAVFNEENGANYEIIPSAWFDLPNNGQVTIKKGEKSAIIPVKVKLGLFDLSTDYGLPVRIKSASSGTISGNFGAGMYSVSPKSILEGTFENTYSGSLGSGTNTQSFSTVSPLQVSSTLIGVYSNTINVFLDPANPTNVMKVVVSGLGEASVIAGTMVQADNYYDEETETLYLDYTLGARRIIQTLKRK